MCVLEPMCGFAEGKNILEQSLTPDFRYDGFDYCETIVESAQKMYPDARIFRMDATKFKSSQKYDLVILIGGLHHIPDCAGEFIRTVYDALDVNGFFINFEPTDNNVVYRIIRDRIYRKNPLFDSESERAFELDELNNIYLSGGFAIVDQMYPGLLSYVLYYNPEAFPHLNCGNEKMVRLIFNMDRKFFRSKIGKTFSFTTLTLMKKTNNQPSNDLNAG